MATSKDRLHWLVDQLPEREAHAAERFLEYLRASSEPLLRALVEAPLEDEIESEEERDAVREAWADVEAGRLRKVEIKIVGETG
ncbi:MAG TPA: hypothetical protein VMM12_05445 [Longimicrobiales bacterium]|nr:hypothetical protein [Longimicrobiales bacterium]